jgi:hypothetical protein
VIWPFFVLINKKAFNQSNNHENIINCMANTQIKHITQNH